MKKFIKKNIKIILGFALGLVWSSGIAYAATILFDSDEVSYDNTTSGLSATNVQSALDELYVESTSYQLFESRVTKLENRYPVGSYYETSDSSFNPNTNSNWTGTWTKETITDDYIVEEGTSGIWTYRKWNSGIAECWGNLSESYTFSSSSWHNSIFYVSSNTVTKPFPFTFSSDPLFLSSPTSQWHWRVNGSVSTTGITDLKVIRDTNSTMTLYDYVYVIGKYKTYTAPSTIYRWHRTA